MRRSFDLVSACAQAAQKLFVVCVRNSANGGLPNNTHTEPSALSQKTPQLGRSVPILTHRFSTKKKLAITGWGLGFSTVSTGLTTTTISYI